MVQIFREAGRVNRNIVRLVLLVCGMLLAGTSVGQAVEPSDQVKWESYRRLDWTGQGTFHRLGLLREQGNSIDLFNESALPEETKGEGGAQEPAAPGQPEAAPCGEVTSKITERLSLEVHANSMYFSSSNVFNTDKDEIGDGQFAQFVGTSLTIDLDAFKLVTGFDRSWFWFSNHCSSDFNINNVKQDIVFERYLWDNVASVTINPTFQYGDLHNRDTGDRILEQWTYGINNGLSVFPAEWVIGTFSYNFSFQHAVAPGTVESDKYKHDFNVGATLIPMKDVRLFVSPSVQFSIDDFTEGGRMDRAWTPTLALTYEPLSFLGIDAVGSYTDSNSNKDESDFQAWAGTLFARLFYRF